MAYSAPDAAEDESTACRRFVVAQTALGRWSARDKQGGILRDFATRKEAIHFALFEIGTLRAAVVLTPSG